MHFEPAATMPGRTAIDVHDQDGRKAATIYATIAGLHIVFEDGYTIDSPGALTIEVQKPAGILIGILRERR